MRDATGLAFQRARFGRRLLRSLFRFSRQIRRQPFDDTALERGSAVSLTDELGSDVRARQFVGIRVVNNDLSIAGQRRRWPFRHVAKRPRKLDGAVLVGVFQARVDDDRSSSAVETLFQIFFGNTRNGHGPYCDRAARAVST